MQIPAAESIEAFYRAGLEGLRSLETREGRGRRFGEGAQAAWRALGGELEASDRVDLLFRDAGATHPLVFSPRSVFDLGWLAEDEPFGGEWPGVRAALAESLLRDAKGPGESEAARLLSASAACWALPAPKEVPGLTDRAARITPVSHFVVAGLDAMLTVATATAGRRDLDLAEQAVVIADGPAERQLWGLVLLLAAARSRPRVLSVGSATPEAVRSLGVSRLDFGLVAESVGAPAKGAAAALLGELGG